jgi:hypothetical protein
VPVLLIGEKAIQPAAVKPRISLGELEKVDIRVGTIGIPQSCSSSNHGYKRSLPDDFMTLEV